MQKRKQNIQRQKRPASIADRAVIVSYGLLFCAIPLAFSVIASSHLGGHRLPLLVYVIFDLFGLLCVALAFAKDVNVSPPSRLER